MSIRTLFPNLLHSRVVPTARCNPLPRLARQAHNGPIAISIPRTIPKSSASRSRSLYTTIGSIGLGLSFLTYHTQRRPVLCDTSITSGSGSLPGPAAGQAPESVLNVYQLGFGTVCGICTGVFLKKGLRAIAFLLGGVFVLMQVSLDSQRLASISIPLLPNLRFGVQVLSEIA